MTVYVYGDRDASVVAKSLDLLGEMGVGEAAEPESADVAIAPLLRRKLTPAELETPTLVFHPSLLPRHRGRDAIKWALAGDPFSGATWFWASDAYDEGDICEQEVLAFIPGESPRQFYDRAVIPSAIRMLRFALGDLLAGHVRRRPQHAESATYEPPFPPPKGRCVVRP